jgi:DNA (cytosine-5)-methyltransferase 1
MVLNGDPELVLGTSRGKQRLQNPLTKEEKRLRDRVGEIDIVVGGPPCQGHSNLNNHTRRNDPKNSLYGRMARFARVFEPKHLIIENVHGARHDQGGIMDRTRAALELLGYRTDTAILHGEIVGVPQTRHRIFLVASLEKQPDITLWEQRHRVAPRSFDWSQVGLLPTVNSMLDVVTEAKGITKERIDWLFERKKYDLPDSMRPPCHRDKEHSYGAVYGRIHPNRPAPTMTTGFTVMGQGRFVHPHKPRTLTPREGARLQFFPSWFSFGEVSGMTRKELVSLIGNAVPPKMAYVLALELFR